MAGSPSLDSLHAGYIHEHYSTTDFFTLLICQVIESFFFLVPASLTVTWNPPDRTTSEGYLVSSESTGYVLFALQNLADERPNPLIEPGFLPIPVIWKESPKGFQNP